MIHQTYIKENISTIKSDRLVLTQNGRTLTIIYDRNENLQVITTESIVRQL